MGTVCQLVGGDETAKSAVPQLAFLVHHKAKIFQTVLKKWRHTEALYFLLLRVGELMALHQEGA